MVSRAPLPLLLPVQQRPRRGKTPLSWLALLAATFAWTACGERPSGSACLASSDCSTGLCYANRCLDPEGDDDGDGLNNLAEHRLHSHPQQVDSDGDGKPDGAEVGGDPRDPSDSDGDNKPDVLESLSADHDKDCLPDELDPDDDAPNHDAALLAQKVCSQKGVCLGQSAAIVASCDLSTGQLSCDYAQVLGWSEGDPCDGLDNDCDGHTDEGHSYQGLALGAICQGVGACGEGKVQCAAGKAVCSSNPDGGQPKGKPEQCNGVDDDCDGKTDEGFVLNGLPVGTPCYGIGECGVGTVICGPTGYPLCSSNPGGPEAQDEVERCDGKDNDCDGLTDEEITLGMRALGSPCMGLGNCGPGLVICGTNEQAVCSSDAGAPDSKAEIEICNGLDDNCDGKTDEGFTFEGALLGEPCAAHGVCAAGVVVCGLDGTATCSTLPDAPDAIIKSETCNNLDDDCDGKTDEDFVYQGQSIGSPCEGVGSCGQGTVECNALGGVTCSTNADGSTPQGTVEQCNGLDDDCDGAIDDGVSIAKAPSCVPKGVCVGASPNPLCLSGKWTCDYPGLSEFEGPVETSCDGKDNDCDGKTDEDLGKLWATEALPALAGQPSARLEPGWVSGGGGLFLAGGLVSSLAGIGQLSPELWRLDLIKGRWSLLKTHPSLARTGATLAWLPPKLVDPQAQIWLLGGKKGSTPSSTAWSFSLSNGPVQQLSWKTNPAPTQGATGLVDAVKHRLWLIGGGPSNTPTMIQMLDLKTQLWLPKEKIPQPKALWGEVATCLDSQGTIYAYGGQPPEPPHFMRLTQGGGSKTLEWTTLKARAPASEEKALSKGRLLCGAAPGEIWLVGAIDDSGGPAGLRRYEIAKDQWSPGAEQLPDVHAGAVGSLPGGELVLSHGLRSDGTPSQRSWRGKPGAIFEIWGGLSAALGAKFIAVGEDLWRIGGGTISEKTLLPTRASWRLHDNTWSAFPSPYGLTGRIFEVLAHDPLGQRVLIWGGLKATGLLSALTSTVAQASSPGAEALDLKTGQMSALPAQEQTMLPKLNVGALAIAGPQPSQLWVFGGAPKSNHAMLWRVDLLKKSKTLLWSQPSAGPAFRRGSALIYDPKQARLVLLIIDGSLQAWRWSLITSKWKKLVSDVTIAQGRVQIWGDPTLLNPLALITFPVGGPSPALRRVELGPQVTLSPLKHTGKPRWGAIHASWRPTTQQALLSRGVDDKGVPIEGLDRWPLICP